MEKVKITKLQEGALNSYKYWTSSINKFMDGINHDEWREEYQPLKSFSPEDFAKMLCGWYEVEQPFEVGDWVYCEKFDKYRKIIKISSFGYESEVSEEDRRRGVERKSLSVDTKWSRVNEPWKIMLLELGREKPEFKIGDKYDTFDGDRLNFLNEDIAIRDFEDGFVQYFYPVESRIEVPKNV